MSGVEYYSGYIYTGSRRCGTQDHVPRACTGRVLVIRMSISLTGSTQDHVPRACTLLSTCMVGTSSGYQRVRTTGRYSLLLSVQDG
jgi:hypothetical protein